MRHAWKTKKHQSKLATHTALALRSHLSRATAVDLSSLFGIGYCVLALYLSKVFSLAELLLSLLSNGGSLLNGRPLISLIAAVLLSRATL